MISDDDSKPTISSHKGGSDAYQSHHSQSSHSGSVASGQKNAGSLMSHHHGSNVHQQQHHVTSHGVQQSNFNRAKVGGGAAGPNLSQQSQILGSSENKQPSLMRGLINESGSSNHGSSAANRGIKIISQNKIRQSPSPPPNLVINSQAPPTVTNIQAQIK